MITKEVAWLIIAISVCIIALIATFRGSKAIISGRWKPSPVTWGIWFVNDILTLFFSAKTGSTMELSLIGSFTIGALIFAMLATKYHKRRNGKIKLTLIDKLCIVGAIASIIAGRFAGDSWGLVFSIITNMIGSIPTYIKVIARPDTEDTIVWLLFAASSVITLFAVNVWSWQTWTTWLFPVYCVIGTPTLAYLSTRRPRVKTITAPR